MGLQDGRRAAPGPAPGSGWTPEFVQLLTVLPERELAPALRAAATDATLRDPVVLALARSPAREDRRLFIAALD